MNVVPDTSAVVDGRVSERVEDRTYAAAARVLIPEAVVGELESQANDGLESGWDGLSELKRLADYADEGRSNWSTSASEPTATPARAPTRATWTR